MANEFENDAAVAVIGDGNLELFRKGTRGGPPSERWLVRLLEVSSELGKKGSAQVAWQRVGQNEEGTLTFDPEHAADAEKMVAALVAEGATRKE